MRKIVVVTFMTMDGVLQAPGGPQEDPTNDFKWGGWVFHHEDDIIGRNLDKIMSEPFDLLLGRRTYEIFAAYWPYQSGPIAEKFNAIHKYVVATTPIDTSWTNSVLIATDVVKELTRLKAQEGPKLLVHGSSRLVQTLLAHGLIDELHIWTYPLTIGQGKKLFQEGTPTREWKLKEAVVTTTGALLATYLPGGEVRTGSYSMDEIPAPERARLEKWAREKTTANGTSANGKG